MEVREHGTTGPFVIAVHGGPAASGSAEPIAKELSDSFRVLEPFQRGSGSEPLTVARHIRDLRELIADRCGDARPGIVGESWGAMLGLAYAAQHPETVGALVLVGCGTFDGGARSRLKQILDQRTTEGMRKEMARLEEQVADENERLAATYALTQRLYDYDPLPTAPEQEPPEPFDMQAHLETWNDMVRCQEEGVYPDAFSRITAPVLMLHGDYDPHPGPMIRDGLLRHIPDLEYHELRRCGHSPWSERQAREPFLSLLRGWLTDHP